MLLNPENKKKTPQKKKIIEKSIQTCVIFKMNSDVTSRNESPMKHIGIAIKGFLLIYISA